MQDVYRDCAAVVLLRKSEETANLFQILLLHKPRKKDAWQLPQGGLEEGESLEEAAMRELKEESGLDAEVIGKSSQVYQYDFPESYRRFRPDNVCGQKVQFVFARLNGDGIVKVDEDEIDSYVWALKDHISKYIKRDQYREIVSSLFEEAKSIFSD